ncbi:hypothetical protein REPUB_Repub13aG0206700 [Reevesia pubescens]
MTAYDGEKNIFSAIPLTEGQFEVELSEGEDMMKSRKFIFSIKLVNELKRCKLRDYLTRRVSSSIPRETGDGCSYEGESCYAYDSCWPKLRSCWIPLGHGIKASRGIQHSLKPTFRGLALCLDYSVLAFRKKMPFIEFLVEHIHDFNVNEFESFREDV